MSISKNDLVLCIDQFISQNQRIISEDKKPHAIKKKELELYLEEYAAEQGISYEKDSQPTKTLYTFLIEGMRAEVEFLYRYSQYYTRHSISFK